MKNWVLGFRFDPLLKRVVLIEKKRPDFLAGKWNGIGGLVHKAESYKYAAFREFYEETGQKVYDWNYFGILMTCHGDIHLFSSSGDLSVRTMTDEFVNIFTVREVLEEDFTVPNLKFLVPMAQNRERGLDLNFYRMGTDDF